MEEHLDGDIIDVFVNSGEQSSAKDLILKRSAFVDEISPIKLIIVNLRHFLNHSFTQTLRFTIFQLANAIIIATHAFFLCLDILSSRFVTVE